MFFSLSLRFSFPIFRVRICIEQEIPFKHSDTQDDYDNSCLRVNFRSLGWPCTLADLWERSTFAHKLRNHSEML